MSYLFFSMTFLFCAVVFCTAFFFCSRIFYLTKYEKVEPVNVFRTEKQISAKKAIDREEAIQRLLENG